MHETIQQKYIGTLKLSLYLRSRRCFNGIYVYVYRYYLRMYTDT